MRHQILKSDRRNGPFGQAARTPISAVTAQRGRPHLAANSSMSVIDRPPGGKLRPQTIATTLGVESPIRIRAYPARLRRMAQICRANYGVYGFRVRTVVGVAVGIRPSSSPRSNSHVGQVLRAVSRLREVLHGFPVTSVPSERVGRAPHAFAAPVEDVRIDHGRLDVPVTGGKVPDTS